MRYVRAGGQGKLGIHTDYRFKKYCKDCKDVTVRLSLKRRREAVVGHKQTELMMHDHAIRAAAV